MIIIMITYKKNVGHVDLETPPPARPVTVTNDISPG